uniref:uncharacterized protein n=1 Tax=Myxine glutinosa TaxID=7769 RepID=UPI00358FA9D7
MKSLVLLSTTVIVLAFTVSLQLERVETEKNSDPMKTKVGKMKKNVHKKSVIACQGKSDGDYEYTKTLYMFWRCLSGSGTRQHCPKQHSFDINAHLCVPFGNSSLCDGRMHVPHPDDPHKFYKCAHGIAFEFTCPGFLIFDDKLSVCTWGAIPTTTPAMTKVTVFNPNSVCVNPPFYLVAHPYNKHKFISCAHGVGYIMSCPATLVFDDVNHYCNWA